MTIAHDELTALVSRIAALIAALEEKLGIRVDPAEAPTCIPEKIASTIKNFAGEIFATGEIMLELTQSDGESCLFATIHVGPDAIPEEVSQRKTELHRRLLSHPATATQNIRIKVVYA